jgi:hypothetical protein
VSEFTVANLLTLFSNGELEITDVGAFWGQVTRLPLPEVAAPVLSIPTTLHMAGGVDGIVYAQLLVGPGLKQARKRAALGIAWSRRRSASGQGTFGVNSFAIPDLGLYWQCETNEADASKLATEFASVLTEEFPDPLAELLRYFSTDLDTLVSQLGEVNYLQAGTTLPSSPG